jgi:hypothetical protein
MDQRTMPATKPMDLGEGNMTQASYDIVIPGTVRQDERLNPLEMLLYGELRGLCRLEGYCWAKSSFLARRMQADSRSIRRWLKKLEDCKHISIQHGDETEFPGATENTRKITLTEGRTVQSAGRTGQSYYRTGQSEGRTAVSAQGRTGESATAPGIRNNSLKTSSSRADDDADFKNIPKKISARFDILDSLVKFSADCGGDPGLMQRYLDHADGVKAKNPVGFAIRLAQERKTKGPPSGQDVQGCGYCDKPAIKYAMHERRKIGLCQKHQEVYVALRKKQQHFAMLAGTDKNIHSQNLGSNHE